MLSFLIAALPALFMWEFVTIKINIKLPNPVRKRLFRIGSRFAILALIFEFVERFIPFSNFPPLEHAFLAALLTAAVPEEIVKFMGVYRFGRKELDEIGPGIAILLAVGISLGFAIFENKLDVLGGGFAVWGLRALTAVPMHAIFGLVMGSFMAMAWQNYRGTDYFALGLALTVPMIFHFAYDFVILAHVYDPSLAWPLKLLPAVMLFEGVFAMVITHFALSGHTAIYGARDYSDPRGVRAGVLGLAMFVLVGCFLYLDLKAPNITVLPVAVLAAIPLVLAVDLSLTALNRMSPA